MHASVHVIDVVRALLVTVHSNEPVRCLVGSVNRLKRKIEEKGVTLCRGGVRVEKPLCFLGKDHGRVIFLSWPLWCVGTIAIVAVDLVPAVEEQREGEKKGSAVERVCK